MKTSNDYKLFFEFIVKFLPVRFDGINKSDPLVLKLNALMEKHNQHFHIGDMAQLIMLFVCDTIEQGLGIKPT